MCIHTGPGGSRRWRPGRPWVRLPVVPSPGASVPCHLRGAPGTELVREEELVRVTALEQGLVPGRGGAPVSATVWDSQVAGSMGRTGSAGRRPRGDRQVMGRRVDGRWERVWRRAEEKGPSGCAGAPTAPHSPAGPLTPRDGEVAPGGRVPALGHREADGPAGRGWSHRPRPHPAAPRGPRASPRPGHDLPQRPHGVVVAHVLEVDLVHLGGEALSGARGPRPQARQPPAAPAAACPPARCGRRRPPPRPS